MINKCFWLPVSLVSLCTHVLAAAPAAVSPEIIPVSPDSQVRVVISNTNPNLLVVPGDKIIGVDSAQGMFTNDNRVTGQANGGIQLMTKQLSPFTFYIRTQGGLTISVVGVPRNEDGRVLHFVSDRPVHHIVAQRWERAQPYEQTLYEIQKSVLAGRLPEGFTEAPVVALPAFRLPDWLKAEAVQMWSGGDLRLYRLAILNTSHATQHIAEPFFAAAGVRAVMIFPLSTELLPGAQTSVWVTMSDAEGG